jgi:hypothetical protein
MPAKLFAAISLLVMLCAVAPARSATAPAPVIDTAIVDGPADGAPTENERPTFSFAATLAGAPFASATFRCSVDDAPVEPCASPFQTDQLEEGLHSFSVFAEDTEHLVADPTPARRTFVVVIPEEDEECEEFEDEEGLLEGKECEEEGESSYPPEECLLRTARARVFASTLQSRVRLVIRYTSFAPADVNVDYRLMGTKGSLKLGALHQHFAVKGLFRLSERLSDAEMDKVRAAKRFIVTMNIPGVPRYCDRYDTRHLTVKRSVHSQVVWFQSDSIFGTGS